MSCAKVLKRMLRVGYVIKTSSIHNMVQQKRSRAMVQPLPAEVQEHAHSIMLFRSA